MREQNSTEKSKNIFPWFIMFLMSSVTFVGILSELMPSGVLPQMMADLNISEVQTGNLVGYYAIASAIFAIPLIFNNHAIQPQIFANDFAWWVRYLQYYRRAFKRLYPYYYS